MAQCEECGSSNIVRRVLDGLAVDECGLCDHLQGDPKVVAVILERRRAEEAGVAVELYGLLETLDSIAGISVDWRISVQPSDSPSPPNVFFSLASLPLVDRLARSLTVASRHTSARWALEATHQGRLLFVLRPRLFHSAQEVDPSEERVWMRDVAVLRDALRRDILLPWWHHDG